MHYNPKKLYAMMRDRLICDPVREVLAVNPVNGRLILLRENAGGIATTKHEDIEYVVLGQPTPWATQHAPQYIADLLGKRENGDVIMASAPSQGGCPPMPSPVRGYAVQAEAGSAPTVIHRTQELAEAEALRLAAGNIGTRFYVHSVFTGHAKSVASVPKPTATLEKL